MHDHEKEVESIPWVLQVGLPIFPTETGPTEAQCNDLDYRFTNENQCEEDIEYKKDLLLERVRFRERVIESQHERAQDHAKVHEGYKYFVGRDLVPFRPNDLYVMILGQGEHSVVFQIVAGEDVIEVPILLHLLDLRSLVSQIGVAEVLAFLRLQDFLDVAGRVGIFQESFILRLSPVNVNLFL